MTNLKTKELTLIAVLSAIIIVFAAVPYLGYIEIYLVVGLTTIHIPVFIGAYFGGRKTGIYLGLLFGITSLLVAFIRPSNALAPVFTNPLVSVLPRFLVGFFAVDVLKYCRKIFNNKIKADILYFVAMTLIHSLLVIPLLYICAVNFYYFDIYNYEYILNLPKPITREGTLSAIGYLETFFGTNGSFWGFLLTLIIGNSLLEIAACTLIGVRAVKAIENSFNSTEME